LKSGAYHTYTKLDDGELVRLFSENADLEVLGVLYKRYMYLVYGVCLKYFANREESQDAVMQIFEVLIREVPRFEIRNFKNWLYGVTRNHCLMQLRKDTADRKRQEKISAEFFMESTTDIHPIEENNDEAMQERLRMCMGQLREEQRRCVELFYYHQYCYREIAAELLLDENKVKSYIQNGKRNLRICIESDKVLKNAGN
jgi:RNA polymerase sigma-70 factor, ECF subfamily